jgi:hypothetical protein
MINFRDILYAHHYNKIYFRRIFPTNTSLRKVAMQVHEVETTRISDYVGPEIRKVMHFRSSCKFSSASLIFKYKFLHWMAMIYESSEIEKSNFVKRLTLPMKLYFFYKI